MQKTLLSIVIALVIISGALFITMRRDFSDSGLSGDNNNVRQDVQGNNVSIVDGVQIIEIKARGGYWPRKSIAKAGVPTILRFNTASTFECSSSVRIPSMNITKFLPQSGTTDIDIGIQDAKTLNGSCGMGMYPFEVEFQG